MCGYCAEGYLQSEDGCIPCEGGGSGTTAVLRWLIIIPLIIIAFVYLFGKVYWHFFGGKMQMAYEHAQQLFNSLDRLNGHGSGLVEASVIRQAIKAAVDDVSGEVGSAIQTTMLLSRRPQ